mmetsp:Transcript_12717/g.41606  ORF Transcript_12717/g.41606 Transcript_12717/m.41606 type:complete len:208 (-) Transcript_12717:501-1124(-)
MAMVGRLLEPKTMTDEAVGRREDASRMAGYSAGRAKAAEVAGRESSINDTLNKVSEYHGVSEHFQKEYEQSSKDVAEAGSRPSARLAHMRRHSGEIDPAAHYAPMKSKPIRWEPHIDEEVRAAYQAAADQAVILSDNMRHHTSGSGVIGVLQDQLDAERLRAHKMQERLEAALRDAKELSVRAARAEAKLEMTEAMLAKMDLAKKPK